ncbi:MAG: hypothetical protein DMG13_30880, partial [Acidobacteria bacterium]
MEYLKSKTAIVALCCLALMGVLGYGMMSMRSSMEDRMNSMEDDLRSMYEHADEKLTMLASDLAVVTKKMGITTQELEQAQTLTKQLKQENAQIA